MACGTVKSHVKSTVVGSACAYLCTDGCNMLAANHRSSNSTPSGERRYFESHQCEENKTKVIIVLGAVRAG